MLPPDLFASLVRHAPLVSIDLVVENPAGEFLLGLRRNRPARGYWFVPGGRIHKGERFEQAFRRTTRTELGLELAPEQGQFIGHFDHLYDDNFSGEEFSTHYLVLAYKLRRELKSVPTCQQHSDYRWMSRQALLADPAVHPNSKAYFE